MLHGADEKADHCCIVKCTVGAGASWRELRGVNAVFNARKVSQHIYLCERNRVFRHA
jgi:hypothetical protein